MTNVAVVGMWLLTLAGFTGLVNKKSTLLGGYVAINTCRIYWPCEQKKSTLLWGHLGEDSCPLLILAILKFHSLDSGNGCWIFWPLSKRKMRKCIHPSFFSLTLQGLVLAVNASARICRNEVAVRVRNVCMCVCVCVRMHFKWGDAIESSVTWHQREDRHPDIRYRRMPRHLSHPPQVSSIMALLPSFLLCMNCVWIHLLN